MTFNINDFKAKIGSRGGLAATNLFRARITPPLSLGIDLADNELHFYCQTVELPGIEFQTADVFNSGFGIAEKRVTGLQYTTLPTVFTVDSEFAVKDFFHRWAKLIYNYDDSSGVNFAVDRQFTHELNYKKDYVGKMEVDVWSTNSEVAPRVFTYEFENVYPVNIGNVSVAWENNDTIMTLPVGFSYDRYKNSSSGQGEFSPNRDRNNGIITDISADITYNPNQEAQAEISRMWESLRLIQESIDGKANN